MYPPIKPYHTFHLTVDHIGDVPIQVFVQLSGNAKGIPVIYLHGGPGDHSDSGIRRLFNPKHYHIIQYDQRGCGGSKPLNHILKNTTWLLIDDMEAIRKYLKIEKFVVSGGSWGTTLALAYAIKHPTLALILRGVFDLSTEPDSVLSNMYPDLDDKIRAVTKGRSSSKMLKSRSRRRFLNVVNDPHPMYVNTKPRQDSLKTKLTLTIVGDHYANNNFFIRKEWIYRNLKKITCPVYIVQGRYDLVTPPIMAYHVCKRLKHCTLHFLDGGHTYHDLINGLVKASDELKKIISP
jgi:proline iminopeptidase